MSETDVFVDVEAVQRRDDLVAALQELKSRSTLSFKALAGRIGRPTTTVNGWFTGRHLPYQRDNDDVRRLLEALGVGDTEPWMEALARCRLAQAEGPGNPYKGLASYEEGDADRFFGRSDLVARLVERAGEDDPNPLVVLGPSGSGKSSLLRAGLVASLRSAGRPVEFFYPSQDAGAALEQALDRLGVESGGVVVVDQFEEVLGRADEASAGFIAALEEVGSRHTVVVGLRSDFFHQAAAISWLLDGIKNRLLFVEPPGADAIPELVNGPATMAGLRVEPALLAMLVEAFQDRSQHGGSALPLLSHVLYSLAESSSIGQLTVSDYEQLGGIDAALENAAEHAFAQLDTHGRGVCEVLFKQLVELRDDSVPTRRVIDLSDFEAAFGDDGLEEVVSAFTVQRILTTGLDSVLISHEALLSAWPRLRTWIADERSLLDEVRRVRAAAAVWSESGQDDHALLGGPQLEAASEVLANPATAGRLVADEREFVTRSRAALERQERIKRRRSSVLTVLSVVAVLAAVAASAFAVSAQRSSDRATEQEAIAQSRQLALQASVLRNTDPVLASQVALVALDMWPTVEARSAVGDASAAMESSRFLGEPGSTALAVTPDGARVAYSNAVAGTITVLERQPDGSYERQPELAYEDSEVDVYALALSPDGRWLASGGTDAYVTLWDLDGDREPVLLDDSLTQFTLPMQSIEFDDSGTKLIGSGTGNGLGVWDVTGDPANESELIPITSSVMDFHIDEDRDLMATAGWDGTVALWRRSDASLIWSHTPEPGTIAMTVSMSPDGSTLVAGYRDATVRVFDISDPEAAVEVETGLEPFGSWVMSVRFSPDGARVAAGSSDGLVRMYDASSWTSLGETSMPNVVVKVRWVGDDQLFATVADGSLRTIDPGDLGFQTLERSIWSVSFTPDGSTMAASSSVRTQLWDVGADFELAPSLALVPPDPDFGLSGVNAISNDGRWIALGTRSGEVLLWSMDDLTGTPAVLTEFIDHAEELTTQDLGAPPEDLRVLVEAVSFDHEAGKLTAAGGEGFVYTWRIGDGGASPYGGARIDGLPLGIGFSTTAPVLQVGADTGMVSLFDTSGDEMRLLSEFQSGDSTAYGGAFHPNGELLALSNADETVSVWDITDPTAPELVTRLTGPNGRAVLSAYSPDGSKLATASGDTNLWVWDTSDPREPVLDSVFSLPESAVYSLAFAPDGSHVAGAGVDARVFLWSLDHEATRERLCALVSDEITPEEWDDYVPGLDYSPPCATSSSRS